MNGKKKQQKPQTEKVSRTQQSRINDSQQIPCAGGAAYRSASDTRGGSLRHSLGTTRGLDSKVGVRHYRIASRPTNPCKLTRSRFFLLNFRKWPPPLVAKAVQEAHQFGQFSSDWSCENRTAHKHKKPVGRPVDCFGLTKRWSLYVASTATPGS